MWGAVCVYSAVFALYGVMEVLGLMPQELISAGLTLPGLFAGYYGDPSIDFTRHHVRRTTASSLLHLSLPLLYCLGLGLVVPQTDMLNVWEWSAITMVMWLLGAAPLVCGLCVALYWSRDGWSYHPLPVQLSHTGQPWRAVAGSVNAEFRDIDKFVSTLGGSVVVVTDSWLVQTNVHSVDIIHQRDAVLNVSSADEHSLTLDGRSAQFLTIHVNSINTLFRSFVIRLNALQYSELTDKLQAPIRTARSVVILQSLSERFAAAFAEQVERNGVYHLPPGSPPLEPCVGCLQQHPQVKLHKSCSSTEAVAGGGGDRGRGGCRECYCRPMWCLSCLSKWFAARQDQARPDVWLSSAAPCPMCRAPFCMLDVLRLEGR